MNYRRKKAQTLAEYAVLFALVITAVVAMRTYMVRALQGRMKDAAKDLVMSTQGKTTQYEPYYLESDYKVTSKEKQHETYSVGGAMHRTIKEGDEITSRDTGGYQVMKEEQTEGDEITGRDTGGYQVINEEQTD